MAHAQYLPTLGWVLVAAGVLCGLAGWGLCWFQAMNIDFQLGVEGDDLPRAPGIPTSLLGRNAPVPEEIGAGATTPISQSESRP